MTDYLTNAAMTRAADSLETARRALEIVASRDSAPDRRWLELCERVDPAAMIRDLMHERLAGAGLEASNELRRRFPHGPCEMRARIPFETLALRSARYNATRALYTGASSLGAYLTQTLNFANAAQALMSMLVLGRLGATAVSADAIGLALPKVNTSSSPYWLATESTQVTESDLVIGQQAFSPHTVGGYTELSRLLILQSMPDAGDVIANDLARRVGREIERVVFAGSGVAGQPHGLAGMTGVNAVSGASYTLATGMSATTDTGDALTDDACPGWAVNRFVASLLRQRQEFSGSPLTLWRGPLTWGALHDFAAGSTSGIASGTAFFGLWRYLVLADFAGGLAIDVNPYGSSRTGGGPDAGNFAAGVVGMRCLASIDVNTVWPAAFTAVTGIT